VVENAQRLVRWLAGAFYQAHCPVIENKPVPLDPHFHDQMSFQRVRIVPDHHKAPVIQRDASGTQNCISSPRSSCSRRATPALLEEIAKGHQDETMGLQRLMRLDAIASDGPLACERFEQVK
jgi:hypothetical protein